MKFTRVLGLASLLATASAWLPAEKIRGVNLGSLFIVEPWMMGQSWANMGCGGIRSEFDCVIKLGQEGANNAFRNHWNTWITQGDIQTMRNYGLNTIRIPIGYWMFEELIDVSERFPRGGFTYLERVAGWAKAAGMYVILDLHGGPGAQQVQQPFTGQYAPTPGFYNEYNYGRAIRFLEWMTRIKYTNPNFSTTFAFEVMNEPLQDASRTQTMLNSYYPRALSAIRNVEGSLGIPHGDRMHVQFMDSKWGSGNPKQSLAGDGSLLFDIHAYPKWTPGVPKTQNDYFWHSCGSDVSGDGTVIVGEWSISVADDVEFTPQFHPDTNKGWYGAWFKAQAFAYEKQKGWVFWSWKTELGNDYRWSYKQSVEAGVIPWNAADGAGARICG